MAVLGQWSGGTTSLVPTQTWAGPNALFPTQDRNDSSAYSWASSTSTVTLPATGLADGYLFVGAYEFHDTSNGRFNPQARIIQASGTGNFVGGATSGYSRDNSEDRAYVRAWAFVDNPSASATFQFQWARDIDNATGGTARSVFQVIPLYYANHGLYSSTVAATYGGTTPNVVTGFSAVDESDTAAIELTGGAVNLKTNNARYLVLGSQHYQNRGKDRTQRWHGLRVDATATNYIKAYSYSRNNNNNEHGNLFAYVLDTETSTVQLDQFCYRGDGVGSGQGGGQNDGASAPTVGDHTMVVLELNNSAEVFATYNNSNQNIATAGPIDVNITPTAGLSILDTDSFTRISDTQLNAESDMDVLYGFNVSAASQAVSSTARFTGYAELTINGTEDADQFAGNYLRGNEGAYDTFGWSANGIGFRALSSGDDIGVSATELSGSEGHGGAVHIQTGWAGFWGLNLDTLQASGGSTTTVNLDAGSYTQTGQALGIAVTTKVDLDAGSYTFSGQSLDVQVQHTTAVDLDAGAYSLTGYDLGITLNRAIGLDAGIYSLTGFDLGVTVSATISLDAGSYTFSGHDLGVARTTAVQLAAGSYTLTGFDLGINVSTATAVALDAGAYTFTGFDLDVTRQVTVELGGGSYTFSGYDLGIAITRAVDLDAGSYAFTGLDLGIAQTTVVQLDAGAYTLTGFDLTINVSTGTTVDLDAGAYTFTGYDLDVVRQVKVDLDAGSYTLTGHSLAIGTALPVGLDAGSYTLTGYDIGISLTRAVALDSGSYAYSGYALTIRQKMVTCSLVDRYGNALPNLVDLHWAWFDTTDPAVMGSPTDQGTTESTDGSGEIVVKVPNSALAPGGEGTLILRSDDGSSLGAYNLPVP